MKKFRHLASQGKKVVDTRATPAGKIEDPEVVKSLVTNYDSHDALLEACTRLVRAALKTGRPGDKELEAAVECGLIAIGRTHILRDREKQRRGFTK